MECCRCNRELTSLPGPMPAVLGKWGSRLGYPPMFFAKNMKIRALQRNGGQECDSKRVTLDFGMSGGSRRLWRNCGGGPSIHVEGFIAHKCLFVKYLCEITENLASC